jgi:tetratricopeptide (TPR) repeat protein
MAAPPVAGDPSASGLAEAFVDDVRRTLRRTAIGDIASRAETVGLPPGASPIDIGRRLRVRWLLVLTLSVADDELRVLAELVDTSTGFLADDWNLRAPSRQLGSLNADLVRRVLDRFVDDPSSVAIERNEPSEAYALYLRGRAALRDGSNEQQLTEAQEIFEGLLLRWPDFARAEASLCQIELMRYETSRAAEHLASGERHCSNALAIDPTAAEADLSLGQFHFHAGQYDRAEAEFRRASAVADVRADASIGLGRIAVVRGRKAEAERAFRAAIADEPGYWRSYTELGNFLSSIGRSAEAVEQHRFAIALARHDGVALNNLGASLFLSGQFDSAVNAWRAALELGDQAPTYSNLGAAYYLSGDYANAVTMHRRSVDMNGDDYRSWSNLADALRVADDPSALDAYRTARDLARREIERNPGNAAVRAGLAAIEAALGEHDAARTNLAEALALSTTKDWELAYLAAVTHARLGAVPEAREDMHATIAAGYPAVLLDKDPAFAGIE